MSKIGYTYDHETGVYTGKTLVSSDANVIVSGYRTDIEPKNVNSKFDELTKSWIELPSLPPSDSQKIISQLGDQIASLTAENQSLKQANQEMGQTVSTLGMQVAQLLAKEQGGN